MGYNSIFNLLGIFVITISITLKNCFLDAFQLIFLWIHFALSEFLIVGTLVGGNKTI